MAAARWRDGALRSQKKWPPSLHGLGSDTGESRVAPRRLPWPPASPSCSHETSSHSCPERAWRKVARAGAQVLACVEGEPCRGIDSRALHWPGCAGDLLASHPFPASTRAQEGWSPRPGPHTSYHLMSLVLQSVAGKRLNPESCRGACEEPGPLPGRPTSAEKPQPRSGLEPAHSS